MILSLALAIVGASAAGAQETEDAPSTPAWQQLGVVRVDHRSKRLFVVPPDDVLASKEAASTYLARAAKLIVTELATWETHWNVSFFASADLAGYKTEFMETDEARLAWERTYLAEFSRKTQRLTYAPLDREKMKHDVIELE